jgi:hypothetical protein
MEIKLTNDESFEIFYNSICNGLSLLSGYGLELSYNDQDYKDAKSKLTDPCFEDVLMQILKDGNTLSILDIEGEGTYNADIKISDVWERVNLTPANYLIDMINENDDADTADAIIQTVFFKSIIFA